MLTIEWSDLPIFATVIIVALAVLYRYWQAQIQIAIDPDIAVSEGVNAKWQRLIFMLLLAFIHRTRFTCRWFITDGRIIGHPRTGFASYFSLSETNGDGGVCDCSNWCDGGVMVKCCPEHLYRAKHRINHVFAVCCDFLCNESKKDGLMNQSFPSLAALNI